MATPQDYQSSRPQAAADGDWFAAEVAERRRVLGRMTMVGLVGMVTELADEDRPWPRVMCWLAREELKARELGKPRDAS